MWMLFKDSTNDQSDLNQYMYGSWSCVIWMWSMSLEEGRCYCRGTPQSIAISQWECLICPDWPIRGQVDLCSSILIGLRRMVVVGGHHSPINHSTSCLQIRGGPAGGQSYFIDLLIYSFLPLRTTSNFLQTHLDPLEQWIPNWSAGTFSNVEISLDSVA